MTKITIRKVGRGWRVFVPLDASPLGPVGVYHWPTFPDATSFVRRFLEGYYR